MCGIVAIYAYHPDAAGLDREELLRMRDRMTPRGPDGEGAWFSSDGRVGLGHRRLAIIDLSSAGAQPMLSEDSTRVITYNGEIYNHPELRDALQRKGYRFRSSSDTEVLLHLYAEEGPGMVDQLRGMFAFALWDASRRGLFMARDPFGMKPLYYSDTGRTIRAASQVKSLMAVKAIDTSAEPAGHVGFFLWGNVPDPFTLYRGIRALPAGSSLWVSEGGARESGTFRSIAREIRRAASTPPANPETGFGGPLRAALTDTVRRHLAADVPVGVFLSAGMDSTTLTALASESAAGRLRTVTLGCREYLGTARDETALAEKVARRYGTEHETVWMSRREFLSDLDSLLDAMDQPTCDGVNTYFVSKAAARAGLKAALSGVGGDELFGGYPGFRQIPPTVATLRPFHRHPFLGRAARIVSAPFLRHLTSPKLAGLLEYGGSYGGAYLLRRALFMPWELPEHLDGEMVRKGWLDLQPLTHLDQTVEGIGDHQLKVAALEMTWYMRNMLLRDSDWAGMAHSLEIRSPLLDLELLRAVVPLCRGKVRPAKVDMASTPRTRLPAEVLNRPKSGFLVPVREWMAQGPESGCSRGLRHWAKTVYGRFVGR